MIQLGLRRDALAAFRGPAFGESGIEDVTIFSKVIAANHGGGGGRDIALKDMLLPSEDAYPVVSADVAQRLGIA